MIDDRKSYQDIIRDALVAHLSDLTEKRNSNEFWWNDGDNKITIESTGNGKYIIRYFYKSGILHCEVPIKDYVRHGVLKVFTAAWKYWCSVKYNMGIKMGIKYNIT